MVKTRISCCCCYFCCLFSVASFYFFFVRLSAVSSCSRTWLPIYSRDTRERERKSSIAVFSFIFFYFWFFLTFCYSSASRCTLELEKEISKQIKETQNTKESVYKVVLELLCFWSNYSLSSRKNSLQANMAVLTKWWKYEEKSRNKGRKRKIRGRSHLCCHQGRNINNSFD